jgi:hypothetical protein
MSINKVLFIPPFKVVIAYQIGKAGFAAPPRLHRTKVNHSEVRRGMEHPHSRKLMEQKIKHPEGIDGIYWRYCSLIQTSVS